MLVYLLTKNLILPKCQARKLCPKLMGPCKVLEVYNETSNYALELLEALKSTKAPCKVLCIIVAALKATEDRMFPNCATLEPYHFGAANDQE